jgi:protein involved in ribonucleotide reduction
VSDPAPSVIYFSSTSENTHRFVQKLGLPAARIPLHARDSLTAQSPYVLIVPTYGGGTTPMGRDTHYVPKQVIKFLNEEHNRSLIRGVIAAGNTNFGDSYCAAGDVISQKCRVPYLYRFELLGTTEDVERVREGLEEFWTAQLTE